MEITIRTYRSEDETPFKQSIVELQNYERGFADGMLSGEEMVTAWFAHTMEENKKNEGEIYVAEVDHRPVGFISVRVEPSAPVADVYYKPSKSVLVSDLHVVPEWRGKGIGKLLLSQADEYAKARKIASLKLEVFAANTHARDLYQALGYHDVAVTMVKSLEK